jgi:hypothetical protein
VGKSEDNCRQIARRARQSGAARRPYFERSPEQEERLTRQFVEACAGGDTEGLLELLSDDITVWSDGGGKVAAARHPIHGPDRVAGFFLGLLGKAPPSFAVRQTWINGQAGIIGHLDGCPLNALTFDVADGRIQAIRFVVNPKKLRALPPLR